LLASQCFLALLLSTSLLPDLTLLHLLLPALLFLVLLDAFAILFPASLLFETLLFLILLDALAVLFPTLLLFRLVLLNPLAVLLPTLLLLRAVLFLPLLGALTHFLRALIWLVLLRGLRGTSRFTLLCSLLLLSLAGLVSLFLFLLVRGAARRLFGLSLLALLLILLTSFLSAAATSLRAGQIDNSKSYHQRQHTRGYEASIVNFH